MVFNFAGVFFLLELIVADQVLSAKIKPLKIKVLHGNLNDTCNIIIILLSSEIKSD